MRIHITADSEILNNYSDRDMYLAVPLLFLERNLAPANGEYLKVYLLLLKAAQNRAAGNSAEIEDQNLCDALDVTLKDVRRAVRFWKKRGELDYTKDKDDIYIRLTPEIAGNEDHAEAPKENRAEAPSAEDLGAAVNRLRENRDFSELLYMIEKYLGKKLSETNLEKLAYWYDILNVPREIIEYIVESCVDAGHTSMAYIEAAVLNAHAGGIRTVDEMKQKGQMHRREFYRILRAFGLKRNPTPSDKKIMGVWIEEYEFPMDIIEEACSRSANKEHPIKYADSILKHWHDADVRTVNDIKILDGKHRESAVSKTEEDREAFAAETARKKGVFTNFPQRQEDLGEDFMEELRRKGNIV